jgi:hypothetical protein
LDKKINKVVRTTRDDFAIGTQAGVYFCTISKTTIQIVGSVILPGKEITELSEYNLDKFVAG